ncbi:hypothetical protein MANES_12G124650v8 [Manihot esculenta]|uniref:Uncharacterized protein n=1 Tax=Manihot esculenta TaxID=3983 RepID=A0ACB7GS66_MANES|nr:hypothetical protein MANES_12G124650v8 [Manihot esculenta]
MIIKHLCFDCPRAGTVWLNSPCALRYSMLGGIDIKDHWTELLNSLEKHSDGPQLIQIVSADQATTWSPPPRDFIKVNFDAAVDSRRRRGVVALLAHDPQDFPIDWFCRRFDAILNPFILKSLRSGNTATHVLASKFLGDWSFACTPWLQISSVFGNLPSLR